MLFRTVDIATLATSLLLSLGSSASFAATPEVDPTRFVLPRPKEVLARPGQFVISKATEIRAAGAVSSDDRFTLSLLANELLPNKRLATFRSRLEAEPKNEIVLTRINDWLGHSRDLGHEGYTLDVSPERIDIKATTARGLYYGALTLVQLMPRSRSSARSRGVMTVPALSIADWPEIRDRMVLYDLRYNTVNMSYFKRWIRALSRMKVNQFMLFMGDDYVYGKYPFMSSSSKLTTAKIRELKRYAKLHHVELIPQLESLGHAEDMLKHEPHRDIRLGDNPYSFSPCTERTYSVLGDFYRELTEEFDQSTLFHVGGDEVWGFDQDPRCRDDIDKHGQEFLYSRHMNRLRDILKPLHRRMAIWGDMLLEHPLAARDLDRDITIFDWHYQEYKDFPSLKYFKDLGFKNIYAAPAVFGHWDIFPEFLVTFQNVPGFTQAALRERIYSICVTIWEMHHGGNAENYLYGTAFSAQVMWASQATDLADFNSRFAAHWFESQDPQAAAHVDRAFWFPWRANGSSRTTDVPYAGYWQKLHQSGDILYAKFDSLIAERSDKELDDWNQQSSVLLQNLEAAKRSIDWLEREGGKNRVTLEALRTAIRMYSHLARKVKTLTKLSSDYRAAYRNLESTNAATVLSSGAHEIAALRTDFAGIEAGLRSAINDRNSNPKDLVLWKETERSHAAYIARLEASARSIAAGKQKAPAPKEIGL